MFYDASTSGSFVSNDNTEMLYLNPDGGSFNGTVFFPPNPLNGQTFEIVCSNNGEYDPITLDGTDNSINNAPAMLSASTKYSWVYIKEKGTWFRM